MAKYMDMDTLRFLLFECHEVQKLLEAPRYADFDQDALNILLDSFKDFADKELYPYFREMDEQAAYYKDGKVIVHPQLEVVLKKMAELGLIGANYDHEDGGMQIPESIFYSLSHIMDSANNNVTGYPSLTTGSGRLIVTFGSQELKDTYVPKMIAGEWGGTMCLTEPQAGSSLSDITSSAIPTEDGYYKISGQKIFISGGDHEYCSNFVHLFLARIDGAPAGTRGISLFVVPKFRPTADGGLEDNDVFTAADFPKLGQKGYVTTHLVFGEKENCRGWLVGEPNRGLKYMFQMMNEARISVGVGALSIATAAYYASLQYAKERPQGRRLSDTGTKNVEADQTLIINHPDVRRMLLLQKAVIEGSLSLAVESAKYSDLVHVTEGEEHDEHLLMLEILTPICKTYPSEMGRVSISNGLQVLGGYGFTSDFVLQQYYRDIRITSLYEGTTGIQSLDLLGRKVTMKNGAALKLLAAKMQESIMAAVAYKELKPYAMDLGEKLKLAQKVIGHLLQFAAQGKFERFTADATVFMDFFSNITIAWQWLKMATSASKALSDNTGTQKAEFYQAKIHTMKFYYKYELPKTLSAAYTLVAEDELTIQKEEEILF